jgi:hypothetical protein
MSKSDRWSVLHPADQMVLNWMSSVGHNFIHILMPENVKDRKTTGDVEYIYGCNTKEQSHSYAFRRIAADSWENTLEIPQRIRIRGLWKNIPDSLGMELELTNLSNEIWHDARATVCVSLAAAPGFADSELKRTYYPDPDSRNELRLVQRSGNYKWLYPFIAVASGQGVGAIAHWFENGSKPHEGNEALACIHASPLYGRIEPAQSVSRRGAVYAMEGTPQEAYQRFLKEGNMCIAK